MKALLERTMDLCRNEKYDLRVRLFRIILLLGAAACFLTTFSNLLILKLSLVLSTYTVIGCALFLLDFFLTLQLKSCRNLFMGVILFTNALLLPVAFFSSGGVESGNPLWLLVGQLLPFIFLDGVRFWITLAGSSIALGGTYLLAYYRPELISMLNGRAQQMKGSYLSIIQVMLLLGCIFWFQTRVYRSQQEQTEKQRRTIEEISESKSLFFANMSHEIRTPINTIIGLNEMILREDVSDEVTENALAIQNASKILLALINDILDLSKIESGKMEIVPVRYEIAAMLSDIVNVIWVRANEKKLEFRIDVAPDVPSVLCGDEVRIRQILVNLLTNAVKYTEKGSISLSIRKEDLENGNIRLRMAVSDTGIGIRQESMEDLFSSFRRVDEKQNRNIEGTGLGLSICKQLVELMDGTITVDSIYRKGSVFTVTVQQQVADSAPVGNMQYALKRGIKKRPEYRRRFEAPAAKILVVDDNEMNLMVAKKLLRETRVQVDTALSGRECLEKTLKKEYHVIFMDQIMPEMDGEETLHVLRTRSEGFGQNAPVVALTANVMAGASERYERMGFDGYLAKPVNAALLETVLLKLLPSELIAYEDEKAEDFAGISSLVFQRETKKRIRITTDCVSDLPEDLRKKYDIRVMYYYITTGEGHFKDQSEISAQNLMEYMSEGGTATSSSASVQEYEDFFANNLMEAEKVIHISMTALASKGYAAASEAAKGFGNVTVLDSGHLSSGMGLVVLKAARMAAEGREETEICREVEKLREKVSTSFIVQVSDNLYKGGRMTKTVYRLTRLFMFHPVLYLRRGRITFYGVFFGSYETAGMNYIRRQFKNRRRIDDEMLFITHAGCSLAQLEQIRAEAEKHIKFKQVIIQQASSAVCTNCGPGTFGLLFLKK